MAKRKKNELDTVLEQLKMSYAAGLNDDLEDSLLNSDENEEDNELSSILEKIFADDDNKEVNPPEIGEEAQTIVQEEKSEDIPDITHSETPSFNNPQTPNNESNNKTESACVDTVKSEEKKVDQVLEIMFGDIHAEKKEADGANGLLIACDADPSLPSNTVIEQKETSMPDENEAEDILTQDNPTKTVFEYSEPTAGEENDEPESTSMYDKSEDESDKGGEHVILDRNIHSDDEIVFDKERYTYDPLQKSVADLTFYKPQKDIDFSVIKTSQPDTEPTETGTSDSSETTNDIEDNDISLLMKLGYEGEISESGQGEHASKVIFKKSKEYKPAPYKIKHGFTGKEYVEPSQIPEIRKKYKENKLFLIIKAIVVSVMALVAVLTDIYAVFLDSDKGSFIYLNLVLIFAVLLIFGNRIYSGLRALIRFDANEYSLPSVVLIESFILNLSAAMVTSLTEAQGGFLYFGGYAPACMAFTAWGEFLDCCRESNVFEFISDNKVRYSAQRHIALNDPRNRYIAKQSRFLSGYHNKTIENKNTVVSTFFVIGILPIIAAISSVSVSLVNNEPYMGINIAAYILLFSAPLSCPLGLSVINFIDYHNLKKNNAVYIGSNACDKIASIEDLVFEDTDVIEITSYIKIDPDGNSYNPKKWQNIAYNIISCLGGPFSKAMVVKSDEDANVEHEIVINSISYNGIDLHFDSSVNVFIGDRQYMLSHNIMVKTDVNLTGAVKGAEKSVIYMAFDKIPRIGFIVNTKIKKTFIDTLELLYRNNISAEVRSYEPEINEYFFESNELKYAISVEKPTVFEASGPAEVSDSYVVASSPSELCQAIVYSKHASKIHKTNKQIVMLQTIFGCLIACVLTILHCMPLPSELSLFLRTYTPILLYTASLLMLIPNIIQIIKSIKRKNI